MAKQTKKMSMKQRKFFIELLTSPSYAEAARRAGYSEKSCRVSAHNNITKYNGFFASIMDAAGIDAKLLGNTIKSGLKSEDERVRLLYLKLVLQYAENMLMPPRRLDRNQNPEFNLGEHAKNLLKRLKSNTND